MMMLRSSFVVVVGVSVILFKESGHFEAIGNRKPQHTAASVAMHRKLMTKLENPAVKKMSTIFPNHKIGLAAGALTKFQIIMIMMENAIIMNIFIFLIISQ